MGMQVALNTPFHKLDPRSHGRRRRRVGSLCASFRWKSDSPAKESRRSSLLPNLRGPTSQGYLPWTRSTWHRFALGFFRELLLQKPHRPKLIRIRYPPGSIPAFCDIMDKNEAANIATSQSTERERR